MLPVIAELKKKQRESMGETYDEEDRKEYYTVVSDSELPLSL